MTEVQQTYHEMRKSAEDLLTKAYALRVSDLETSIRLADQVIAIAFELKDEDLVAQAKNQIALFLMVRGQFEQALIIAREALKYFEKAGNAKGIADAKYSIASVYYKTDNYHLGLEVLLDCLYQYRSLNDFHNEARVLKSLGTIYEYFGDQENAINAYLNSIKAGQGAEDPNLESNAYNPLSGIYLKRNLPDLALSTIEKSIDIKTKTKDIRGLAFALYGRGKVYIKTGKYSLALQDLQEALRIQTEMGDQLGIAMAYNKLGVLNYHLRNYEMARSYTVNAQKVADKYKIQFIRYKSLYHLHLIAKAEHRIDEALQYLNAYLALKESIINSHTYNIIKSYETISHVKALEHEAEVQRHRTEIIEKKNAELDSFFYRVSHDLKGPISSLLGLHNLVKHEIKDEVAKQYFDMYQTQIMRINNIVMDLIDLTRMNNTSNNFTRIDFDALIKECISAYHYLPHYSSIRFIKDLQPDIQFHSEWAIMNTILQNLIENAIKYARADNNPYVRIVVREEGSVLIIEVEDNGLGIGADHHTKVFEMFFRANDEIDGTGLGLYILKRAVERLHGDVSFKSALGKGTKFTVKLPAAHPIKQAS